MTFDFLQLGTSPARTDRHLTAGVVTVDGVPDSRHIILIDRKTLTMIAATSSRKSDGGWSISGIPEYPERGLIVLSLDNTGNYNAEVADYISQVTTA